jgi:hypothetical protein
VVLIAIWLVLILAHLEIHILIHLDVCVFLLAPSFAPPTFVSLALLEH